MRIAKAIIKANRVYLCGNGGSAANALHIANDLFACGVKAHALVADVSTLTAIANDHGYENVFSKQVSTFGEKGDLLICLSGSGKSPNILKALEAAVAKEMETWLVTGDYHTETPIHAKHILRWGANMQNAEDAQVHMGHSIMRYMLMGPKSERIKV